MARQPSAQILRQIPLPRLATAPVEADEADREVAKTLRTLRTGVLARSLLQPLMQAGEAPGPERHSDVIDAAKTVADLSHTMAETYRESAEMERQRREEAEQSIGAAIEQARREEADKWEHVMALFKTHTEAVSDLQRELMAERLAALEKRMEALLEHERQETARLLAQKDADIARIQAESNERIAQAQREAEAERQRLKQEFEYRQTIENLQRDLTAARSAGTRPEDAYLQAYYRTHERLMDLSVDEKLEDIRDKREKRQRQQQFMDRLESRLDDALELVRRGISAAAQTPPPGLPRNGLPGNPPAANP